MARRWRAARRDVAPEVTTVDYVANLWLMPRAILHDLEMYPEPDTFKPERFIKDGKLNPEVRDPDVACFGYGRRSA